VKRILLYLLGSLVLLVFVAACSSAGADVANNENGSAGADVANNENGEDINNSGARWCEYRVRIFNEGDLTPTCLGLDDIFYTDNYPWYEDCYLRLIDYYTYEESAQGKGYIYNPCTDSYYTDKQLLEDPDAGMVFHEGILVTSIVGKTIIIENRPRNRGDRPWFP